MKKVLLTLGLMVSSLALFARFHDTGYKNIKLGMTQDEINKIAKVEYNKADKFSYIKIDGITLILSFEDGKLYGISSEDAPAKIEGSETLPIGKTKAELLKTLATKLVKQDAASDDNLYVYYPNEAAKKNKKSSCIFMFDGANILKVVSTSIND